VFHLGEGDGINVPTTLMLLAFAPWSSNRSTLTSATPLTPDVFNLGGVLGLIPGGIAFGVRVVVWLPGRIALEA